MKKYKPIYMDTIEDDFLKKHVQKYEKELKDFTYIHHDNLDILKKGGTIKYINLNGELKYGGFLINTVNSDLYTTLQFLLKCSNVFYTISYSSNYIFYCDPIKKPKKPKPDDKKVIFKEMLVVLDKMKKSSN